MPGAEIDLALSLAYRHELDSLINGERVSLWAVCALFKTNDLDQLAWELARKHVPGFRPPEEERWQGRLTSAEWVTIFFAVFAVADDLTRQAANVSDHAIARVLLDEKQLRKIIPPIAVASVRSILGRTGNKERGGARALTSRNRFFRERISQARKAWTDFKSGKANDFQMQMLTEVWPLLHSLTAERPGQNVAVSDTAKKGF
jgi:hypothetical protein